MKKRPRHKNKNKNELAAPLKVRRPFWQRPITLLGAAVTSVLGIIAATLIPSFLVPELRVVREIPYMLSRPSRTYEGGEQRQVFAVHLCVENSGLRSGRLKRAELLQAAASQLRGAELLMIDQSPIRWLSSRAVEIRFLLAAPISEKEPPAARWRIDLYDDADKFVGDISGVSEFPPVPDFTRPFQETATINVAGPEFCEAKL